MLDPKPVGSAAYPKPVRIFSKAKLREAWASSRDSTTRAGSAGIDNETAKQFASNLDSNLSEIRKRLLEGTYGFSRLRPVFIRKPNSTKDRVICIPTVRDRIVQRTIVRYLSSTKRLPIYNSSSYGFIEGRSTADAVNKVVELRSLYEWCVKADIESFFDQIPRGFLKERVSASLNNHSLVPLIHNAIDCEVRTTKEIQERLQKQGIRTGVGVRQGMPLSPTLANLVLSKFDRSVQASKIPMVRYADDLLLFFGSREEAKHGQKIVEQLLASIHLKLAHTKTFLYGPHDPVDFLGRQIVLLESLGKYVARVSRLQIRSIKDRLEDDHSYSKRTKSAGTINDSIVELSRSVAAYLGAYRDAHNYAVLIQELEASMRLILSNFYAEIFGDAALEKLDGTARRFLGVDAILLPTASYDFE